jgi:hypothetical protein
MNDLEIPVYPVRIPRLLWWGSYHKALIPYRRVRGQSPVLSNGVYSNRLDQAGLDSPPFDGVKPL